MSRPSPPRIPQPIGLRLKPRELATGVWALLSYPAWAIGADRTAPAAYVREAVTDLKDLLHRCGASDPEVLYGGTVNKKNINQFARLDVLDGVGATRGSLNTQEFFSMIDCMAGSG